MPVREERKKKKSSTGRGGTRSAGCCSKKASWVRGSFKVDQESGGSEETKERTTQPEEAIPPRARAFREAKRASRDPLELREEETRPHPSRALRAGATAEMKGQVDSPKACLSRRVDDFSSGPFPSLFRVERECVGKEDGIGSRGRLLGLRLKEPTSGHINRSGERAGASRRVQRGRDRET